MLSGIGRRNVIDQKEFGEIVGGKPVLSELPLAFY